MKKVNKQEKKLKLSFKLIKEKIAESKGKAVVILTLAILLLNLLVFFPMPALASMFEEGLKGRISFVAAEEIMEMITPAIENKLTFNNKLPRSNDLEVSYTRKVVFTAYNSEVAQCDSTPCITANGFNVCEHGIEDTIAMNGIAMGTKIRIPELFGERVFVVRDRMNSRYDSSRGDVWMLEKQAAREFGVKLAMIEVLK